LKTKEFSINTFGKTVRADYSTSGVPIVFDRIQDRTGLAAIKEIRP